jgi:hypothetical protein
MNRPCRWLIGAFVLLYLAALGLLAVGTFGLFGAERDPLSAVFLLPLGLPWNRWIDAFPEAAGPWLAVATPLLNLLLAVLVCRWWHVRSASGRRPGAAG